MRKTETSVEHNSRTNIVMHDLLMKEFMLASKGEKDVEMMLKISSNIAYLQQTNTTLMKNLYIEKHIKEINTKLDRIPPEILQSMMSPKVLEPIET